jgi:hypothetical protein
MRLDFHEKLTRQVGTRMSIASFACAPYAEVKQQ